MPGRRDIDDSDDDYAPQSSLRQRLVLRRGNGSEKAPLMDRLRSAFLKPAPEGPDSSAADYEPPSVDELEARVRSADDKERLIGLIAAPFAAAIGILVISALIVNDPPAHLKDGLVDTRHVSLSLYHELELVMIALSVLILVMAMLRKRLYLGIVMALYGLAIFNLHYWGFGIPFIMGGAWLLVRAYRAQRDLREASGGQSPAQRAHRSNNGAAPRARPQANKRYTPPAAAPKRSST